LFKDKQIELEARQLVTQAHQRGNAAVRKVVDYTRQQLGYILQKFASKRKQSLIKSNHPNQIKSNQIKSNQITQNKPAQRQLNKSKHAIHLLSLCVTVSYSPNH
jgi:hypothetical protein